MNAQEPLVLVGEAITGRGQSVNPFIVVEDAAGFIDFAADVFAAQEVLGARTSMPDGQLIHAELQVGDSLVLLADRLEGWPLHPGLFQVWVVNGQEILPIGGHEICPRVAIRSAR